MELNLELILAAIALAVSGFSAFFTWRNGAIQDTVELYATAMSAEFDENSNCVAPARICIRNVGTRIVYIDRYIFNDQEYKVNGQIRPPAHLNIEHNYYWIELPTDGNDRVLLLIEYRDIDNRKWKTKVTATLKNNMWKVESYPRKKHS